MLTPRMPLYIPAVYNVFLYTSTVAAWRLNLAPVAEAALTGLMGEMIYAPYDITGNKSLMLNWRHKFGGYHGMGSISGIWSPPWLWGPPWVWGPQ